jgi:hypothetical protein
MVGGSVHDLVVGPLGSDFEIELVPWDGVSIAETDVRRDADVSLWFQFAPPANAIAASQRHVWLPMWDDVRRWSRARWDAVPKHVRVVAFSQAVAQRARATGLTVLELQYFKYPEEFAPAEWDGKRVALYWNRTGLVGPEFLARFCEALRLDTLLFRPNVDSANYQNAEYTLPAALGQTKVDVLPPLMERDEFWRQTSRANILLAPRLYEGAGMFMLEAMARGCAVFAHDAPTMNEYIRHNENGYLLASTWNLPRLVYSFRVRAAKRTKSKFPPHYYPVRPERQNWPEIAALNLPMLGAAALETSRSGFRRWVESIPAYIEFVTRAAQGM